MDVRKCLNDKEIRILCDLISGVKFRRYYQKNPKAFDKIKPGFRVRSLSNDDAVALAIKNISKPFISDFVNLIAEEWLHQIDEAINAAEKDFNTHEEVLAHVLIDSYFVDNLDIYFKLKDEPQSEDYLKSLKSRIDEVADERKAITEDEKPNASDESGKSSDVSDKYEQRIETLSKEKEKLNEDVLSLQKSLAAAEVEIKHFKELQKFSDDLEDSSLIHSDYDFVSICEVLPSDYNGNQFLLRMADIDEQGIIKPFTPDDTQPKQFENRSLVYFKNGPQMEETVAIWEWRAIPNKNDFSKDYVESEYNKALSPIEICVLSGCETVDNVVELLKRGINYHVTTNRVLFTTQKDKKLLTGVLCKDEYNQLKEGLDDIKSKIKSEKKTAAQIHVELEKQIDEANNNAAEFLTKMALYNNPNLNSMSSENSKNQDLYTYYSSSALNEKDLDLNENYKDVVTTVSYELAEAGVIPELTYSLAAYLFAAYVNKMPLLLVGPNAENIADAFSIGMFGRKPGILDCSGKYDAASLTNVASDNSEVVILSNLLFDDSIKNLPKVLSNIGRYCIIIHPFPEDLNIEPHSLYNYVLPVNTELLINSAPSCNYTGGKMTADYKGFERKNTEITQNKAVNSMRVTPRIKLTMLRLISDMKEIIEIDDPGYELLYVLIPFAQSTNQMNDILDLINSDSYHIENTYVKDTIRAYFGDANE